MIGETVVTCPHEADVVDAVASGRWPARIETHLREHVAGCRICTDLAEVAGALHTDQLEMFSQAPVPTAEVVWWRAQMRARAEAARIVARPVAAVQAIGAACAVGAVAGLLGTTAWWLRSWIDWLSTAATLLSGTAGGLDVAGLATRGILLALAVWLVLAPIAVYLAATED
jgi:hypothetical protein